MFSLYKNKQSYNPKTISADNYYQMIKFGTWQDVVIKGRAALEKYGKGNEYKAIKTSAPLITGSCVMRAGEKLEKNIEYMNGFLLIDIDVEITDQQVQAIKQDKFTHISHLSFGGKGYCNFVKIDNTKDFNGIFNALGQYYLDNFNIKIDPSCRNINRLRFASYDPDIYINEKSNIFKTVKREKKVKKKTIDYIFTQSDFDNVLLQIKDRGIDICRDDYDRFVKVGMSIANEFGESGRDSFHLICSFGTKYNYKSEDRTYTGFVKRASGKSTIGSFYALCKEEGIEVYSEKTKAIINRVKSSKAQGKPTVESISKTLKVTHELEVNDEDKKLIKNLIDSTIDYSQNANAELTEIEQIENFIKETYTPTIDAISRVRYINENTRISDTEKNDIYITCKKNFEFTVTKNDVSCILDSSAVRKIDTLKKFFNENQHEEEGYIKKYISAIEPASDYNEWCFKRWIVGAVHNWMAKEEELLVCPLTLVLTGQGHGIGKTSFIRNFMPKELRKYFIEGKLDSTNKDSMFRLASNLVVFDDEFGGKAMKDVKDYKSISDSNIITDRRPYASMDETFKRRAILCGSTNETDILKDITGNRRILPIHCEKIDYELITTIDHSKLIVEAYNLWRNGFDWKIYKKEDIEYLHSNTIDNNVVMPVEELFFKYFAIEQGGTFMSEDIWNQGEILNYMLQKTNLKVTKYDIKDIIIKNNLKYKNCKTGNGAQKKGIKLFENTLFMNSDGNNFNDKAPF